MRSSDAKWIEAVRTEPIYRDGVPSISDFRKQLSHDPIKYGIACRAFGETVPKMIQYIVLGLRVSWSEYCAAPFHSLWHSAIWAIAINDVEWLNNAIEHADNPDAKHGPHPPYYQEMNRLFFAALKKTEISIESAGKIANKKSLPSSDAVVAQFLYALMTNDSQLAVESLSKHLMSRRKIRFIDPAYKLYNVMTHGLYELAREQCPELVVTWDTNQEMPWDKELFEWRRTGQNAISVFENFSETDRAFLRMRNPTIHKM